MEKSKQKKRKKRKEGAKNLTLELKFYDHGLLCQKIDMSLRSKFV